ncbi:hypothetical protein SLS53_006121 [Cytospora paraplurivora]|uniref:D-xylose 1-dehydrogenase (NADP(+), D-xylono-1,5-lactone-forming) n=1 Tax=Cytospora paraplurivora TaxID=2898453 RepID=A0AAN9YEZ8_9PEZI
MGSLLTRVYTAFNPPTVEKESGAIRFGILGAARTALHYEWAVRSIRAGKHVLLEKPATSNAIEASKLFNMPELQQPGAPVLLEAFHGRFHPAIQLFRSFITPADVVHADTTGMVPWVLADKNGIEFNYDLAGGCMAHLGS